MYKIKDEEYKGYTIALYYDDYVGNPREDWDCNFSHIICFGDYKYIGDKHDYQSFRHLIEHLCYEFDVDPYSLDEDEDECGFDIEAALKALEDDVFILPVSYYDHGGVTVWLGAPRGMWDSGRAGVCYMTKRTAIKELGATPDNWKELAQENMETEVKTQDDYINGNVYGFQIFDEEGCKCEDSAWGFWGDDGLDEALSEAKGWVDYYVRQEEKELAELEAMIAAEKAGYPTLFTEEEMAVL